MHNSIIVSCVFFSQFCAMMCSGCFVLAVVGHYVPGIMISYIIGKSLPSEAIKKMELLYFIASIDVNTKNI